MTIAFSLLPSTLRIPFVGVEFNASNAQQGPSLLPYSLLHIGQKLSTGAWAADSVNRATSVDQVIAGAGRGSIAHRQAIASFASNTTTDTWFAVLADNGAGVQATGTIVVTGPAAATAPIALYFGAVRVVVAVTIGDASTAIATNIAAAVTANPDLMVTAVAASSTVTFTFRHKGTAGNAYDIRHSFLDGEVLPAGVGLTITAMGGVIAGATNPVLTNLIAAIGDLWFQIWSHPYTDTTNLGAIEAELLSRLGPMRAIDGVAVTSTVGAFSAITTLGAARNSGQSEIIVQPGDAPLTPPLEFAAEVAAVMALAGAQDPARPFQTLALRNAISPGVGDQWSAAERDAFLHSGIATSKLGPGGVVQLDRMITTYQKSPSGAPDTAYLDATTLLTLLYLRYDFRTQWTNTFPRHKLAGDATIPGSGQAIVTPSIAKAWAVGWFVQKQNQGLVEDVDQFKRDLVVERDAGDPNRLNFLLPPNLINGLIVTGVSIAFRL